MSDSYYAQSGPGATYGLLIRRMMGMGGASPAIPMSRPTSGPMQPGSWAQNFRAGANNLGRLFPGLGASPAIPMVRPPSGPMQPGSWDDNFHAGITNAQSALNRLFPGLGASPAIPMSRPTSGQMQPGSWDLGVGGFGASPAIPMARPQPMQGGGYPQPNSTGLPQVERYAGMTPPQPPPQMMGPEGAMGPGTNFGGAPSGAMPPPGAPGMPPGSIGGIPPQMQGGGFMPPNQSGGTPGVPYAPNAMMNAPMPPPRPTAAPGSPSARPAVPTTQAGAGTPQSPYRSFNYGAGGVVNQGSGRMAAPLITARGWGGNPFNQGGPWFGG